jgi:L1 cell adhesion molecule like protein
MSKQSVTTILSRLKALAESYLHQPVEDVVITVPASSNDFQRQMTRDAGRIAGLNILRLLNAPTAAGIAQWMDRPRNVMYYMLVLDVGASRADATLLEVCAGMFEVKSSAGDTRLGGRGYDSKLLQYLALEAQDERLMINQQPLPLVLEAAEQLKISLSVNELSQLGDLPVTRSRFEGICEESFEATAELVSRVLRDANVNKATVKEVVLVGSSTRIPKLQQVISDFFDHSSSEIHHPDMASVRGAALQASSLSETCIFDELLVMDIVVDSIHVEMPPGILIQLWPRNTLIIRESSVSITFRSCMDLPRHLRLLEGDFGSANVLGVFDLTPLHSHLPVNRGLIIEVKAAVDLDGVVDASIVMRNLGTGTEATIPLQKDPLLCHRHEQSYTKQSNIAGSNNKGQSEGLLHSYISFLRTLSIGLATRQQESLWTAINQAELELNSGQNKNDHTDRLVLESLIR